MAGRILIDASGGDKAPAEIIKGAAIAAGTSAAQLVLIGREDEIKRELDKHLYPKEQIEILNAPEVITPDEPPLAALKSKKESSIVVGLNALKERKADAFVSAGSTGALLAGATLTIGRIPGIERPALGALLPGETGFSFLIDAGANVDAKASQLLQYAQLGAVYMNCVMQVKNPRVALVNIGTEKEKGNALTKEAYALLENAGESGAFNFIGNIEARDIPAGAADVLVCDAFVGNVILKLTEGLATSLFKVIKQTLTSGTISKIGASLCRPAFTELKKRFDYTEVGGAPLLGLNALVVKAHGSSDAKAIKGAISQAAAFIENDMTEKIIGMLAKG